MGRLHNKLVETYAEHFARLNAKIDPRMWTDQDFGPMTATYGDLIAALPVGSKVLDLGCGTGATLAWLSRFPGLVPLGVDASPTQVEIARCALPGVQIECSDGLSYLRRHPQTFNGIICTDVLEHIPGDDLCLEWVEAARDALVPGGLFLCRMPNAANLAGSYSRYLDLTHQRSFTSGTALQLLEAAGLERCRVVPIRAHRLGARLRLKFEDCLHRAVFRTCGYGQEYVFTNNINAVGYRALDGAAPQTAD